MSAVKLLSLALGAQHALAHVIMIEPHPFNLDTPPLLQTWPLDAELPFPCQGRYEHAEQVTTVTAGKTQAVKFWGSAVHGGGSCQFSVAYGETPPKNREEWKAIYSIQGGCPAQAEGNIPTLRKDPDGREDGPQCGNDSGMECTREFQIPIPKDMKNGPATFAWTWFNKIGNREMYMVCAPIVVTGGKDDSSFVDTLPPIFVANIPGECTTGPSGNVIAFPEPGAYGKRYEEASPGSEGSCPAGESPDFDEPANGGDDPAPSSVQAPATSSAAPVPTSISSAIPASSAGPVTFVTTSTAGVPSPTQGNDNSPVDVPADGERPDWAVGMTPCSPPGALVCLEDGVFGICNHGWTLPQKLGDGMACVDGQIVVGGI